MKTTCKVMLARFPGDNKEHPESSNWIMRTYAECLKDPRIEQVLNWHKADTPITMTRNLCLEHALDLGMDYVLMIDSDMRPDEPNPGAKPFWKTAFDFAFNRPSPCIIAAPYCGGGSYHNNIFAFRWAALTNNHFPFKMEQYTREEALQRAGIEKVAAMPTGLMLIDMRILKKMKKPYFEYEWKGDGKPCPHCGQLEPGPRAEKASTEDCFFTREISMGCFDDPDAGVFCAWDCWAIHIKPCEIGKPKDLTIDMVNKRFVDAVLSGRRSDEVVSEQNVVLPKITPPEKREGAMYKMIAGRNGNIVELYDDKFREVIRDNFSEHTGNNQAEI